MSSVARLNNNTPFQNMYSGGESFQMPGTLVYMATSLSGLTVPLVAWMISELNRMGRDSALKQVRARVIRDWASDPSLRKLLGSVKISASNSRFLNQLNKIARQNNDLVENQNLQSSMGRYKDKLDKQIKNLENRIDSQQNNAVLNRMRSELQALKRIHPNAASGNWTRALQSTAWTNNSNNNTNNSYNPYKIPGFLQHLSDEATQRGKNMNQTLRSQWTAMIHFTIALLLFVRMMFVVAQNYKLLMDVNEDVVMDMGMRIKDMLAVVGYALPTVSRQAVETMVSQLEARGQFKFKPQVRTAARFGAAGMVSIVAAAKSNELGRIAMNGLVSADNTYRQLITFFGTTAGKTGLGALTSIPGVGGKVVAGTRAFRDSLEVLSDTLYQTTLVIQSLMLASAAAEYYRAQGFRENKGRLERIAAAPASGGAVRNNNIRNFGPATATRSAARANRSLTMGSPQMAMMNSVGNRATGIPMARPAARNNNSNNNRR